MPPSENGKLWHVLCVTILGGLLVGFNIGFAGVQMTFENDLANCTRYGGPKSCGGDAVKHLCVWVPEVAYENKCMFRDQQPSDPEDIANWPSCSSVNDADMIQYRGDDRKALCKSGPNGTKCIFQSNGCKHEQAWSANLQGLFSGMMVIAGMIGSLPAGNILNKIGRKKTLLLTGVLGLLSAIFYIIGWQIDSPNNYQIGSYAMLVIARFLGGLAVGIASVACPMYCGEMTPERFSGPAGCTFQISVTFGIFWAAAMGYAVHQAQPDGSTSDMNLHGRFQTLNAFSVFFSLGLGVVAMIVNEPLGRGVSLDEQEHLVKDGQVKLPWSELKAEIVIAVALAAAQQLTGINAIMNYAPTLSVGMGMAPLEGNLVIMSWNFVTTIASLKLAHMFPAGKLYIASAFLASLFCLCTAIPTFPTVFAADDTAGKALTAIGIAGFIAAFEMGMGPTFYVLAQSIFPASRRSEGCSFTIVVQFIFNIIINYGYPVTVEGISGGPDADQRKGTAWTFLGFGIIGIMCVSVLFINMKAREKKDADGSEVN